MSFQGGSFSDWLRERNRAAWEAMVGHRFCRDVAGDALPEVALVRYLRFEHAFVRAAVRIFAYALAKAEEPDDQDRLVAILQGLAGEQEAYFCATFASLGRDARVLAEAELPAAARDLRDGVLAIAAAEPFPRSWPRWRRPSGCTSPGARRPRPKDRSARPRRPGWRCTRPSRSAPRWPGSLRRLDELGPALPPARQERCAAIFGRVLALEIAFHDAPYGG